MRKLIAVLMVLGVALATLGVTNSANARQRQHNVNRACLAVAHHNYTKGQIRLCRSHPRVARLIPSPHKRVIHHTGSKHALARAVASGKVAPLSKAGCAHHDDNGWSYD